MRDLRLLTIKEVAEETGRSINWLKGHFIYEVPHKRIGNVDYWPAESLADFMNTELIGKVRL